jgi:hypothetical protein
MNHGSNPFGIAHQGVRDSLANNETIWANGADVPESAVTG